jgi:soluble lytic murein transglycosylase-like protein
MNPKPMSGHVVSAGWAKSILALSLVLMGFAPLQAHATAQQDPAPTTPSLAFSSKKPVAAPLEISEVPTTAPYMIGTVSDANRQQTRLISNYIQTYNRRLAGDEINNISQAIVQYSGRYGVDYRLLTSIIAVESAFRRDAVSSSGAIGMGQLKPDTARWLGVVDPYDPVDNIAGTARFVSWLVRRYNGNLEQAISAYYQGPGHVDRNGITPVCVPYLEKVNRALGSLL